MDPITTFVEGIAQEVGINELPQEFAEEAKKQLASQFTMRVGILVMNNLPEAVQDEYMRLTQDPATTPEATQSFLDTHIPDFGSKLGKMTEEFREEAINAMKQ